MQKLMSAASALVIIGLAAAILLIAKGRPRIDAVAANKDVMAERSAAPADTAEAYTPPPGPLDLADIVRDPADVPPPVGNRNPRLVKVFLKAEEVVGELDQGVSYNYWTFNGKVPGPMIRVEVGDTVELHLANPADCHMVHSIDLHAVLGPGGGSAVMQAPPGQERVFTFRPLYAGLFVYHCATPMMAEHISNGMYGMILVEPPGGLLKVDHEFYFMEGEIYTKGPFGQEGLQAFDMEKLLDERPTYVVFNGAAGALTQKYQMHAEVGQSVRLFFGEGGPNETSSFHVVGEILDRVWPLGSLARPPMENIQTVSIPPGCAVVAELTPRVPGQYALVDHAMGRMMKGLQGMMDVKGKGDPELFHAGPAR